MNSPIKLSLLLTILTTLSLGHADWELRVCQDPNQLPFSNQAGEGFDNRIATILAEELGATLVPVWASVEAMEYVRTDLLYTGECDMVMGIEDSNEGFLNTLTYYRSPHVFVYDASAPFELNTLDDDALAELNIGLAKAGSAPHHVLLGRGLRNNLKVIPPGDYRDTNYLSASVQAVLGGTVDVALEWGPIAGYFAATSTADLEIKPVTPEVYLPYLLMVHSIVIGVRPGDEALRDLLNSALARRWQDIQAVLNEYSVPLAQLPTPSGIASVDPTPGLLHAGVIVPMTTSLRTDPDEVVGQAAVLGARMAADEFASNGGTEVALLLANAPDAGSAERAARRLIERQGATVLIGGVGDEQARVLAEVANDAGVLFLNIGSANQNLRIDPPATTFHIEASAEMYLRSTLEHYHRTGVSSWTLIHGDGAEGASLWQLVDEIASHHPSITIDSTQPVEENQVAFTTEIMRIAASDVTGVLLLLPSVQQEYFLSQYRMFDLEKPVAVLPNPVSQTRESMAALSVVAAHAVANARVALWEMTLPFEDAAELVAAYTARWGEPMDPSAWAAYTAIAILDTAANQLDVASTEAFVNLLMSEGAAFDIHKDEPAHFDSETRQLVQPLYIIAIEPETKYAPTLQALTNLARYLERAP